MYTHSPYRLSALSRSAALRSGPGGHWWLERSELDTHPAPDLLPTENPIPAPTVPEPMRTALRALASPPKYMSRLFNLHDKIWATLEAPARSATDQDPIDGILSVSDAAALWHLDTSTIRRAIKDGRLKQDLDCYKLGKQWAVTKAAITRLYGTPQKEDQG